MSQISRHLVAPQLAALMDIPARAMTTGLLAKMRASPIFDPDDLPVPVVPGKSFTITTPENPELGLLLIDPPSSRSSRPAILYVHGGGMVMGTVKEAMLRMPAIAQKFDCPVLSVDYRLAPETSFPGPQEDVFSAFQWLVDNAEDLSVDPERIVVMGVSAGGGLVAALTQMTRDRGGQQPASQVLIYPMLDARTGGEQSPYTNELSGEFVWTGQNNQFGWEAMRGDYVPEDAAKGWFSPALADDLSGLPPAYIATGALDLFVDEDMEYTRRLAASAVPVELHVYPGAIHGFDMLAQTDLAKQFEQDLLAVLEKFLAKNETAGAQSK